MINEILLFVDKNTANEKFAVFCSLIDLRQAFDRQCPTLGVQSFVNIIPLVISYFQDRRMIAKWHGVESTQRSLNGGDPKGALYGILEYLSQSNGKTDFISSENKFKFIDDLSTLDKINILSIGISSYNF